MNTDVFKFDEHSMGRYRRWIGRDDKRATAQRSGLKVGDSIAIDMVGNKPIAAIIADYGNPNGQIVAASELIQSIDNTLYARQFGIRTQHVDKTKEELISAIGLAPGQFIDQASLKTASMKVFDRTFTVTKKSKYPDHGSCKLVATDYLVHPT